MVLGAYAVEIQGDIYTTRILSPRHREGRRFVLVSRRFLRKLSRALHVTLAIESIETFSD